MPNRLEGETSPYLLQHAHNPVDWYPWGPEALSKAKNEQKPIFLSIGYAACHWCHVMAHESFEDPRLAAIMNEHFVNIKVDREERPDLDAIYMNAVVSMTGHGGWPMSVFLSPEGEPFFGGTYFPPVRRFNMPSFEEILLTVSRLWHEDRESLLKSGRSLTEHLQQSQQIEMRAGELLDPEVMERAALRLAQSYDWKYGGWGQAPKFPQPMAIEFLLRRASDGDRLSLDTALHALLAMSKGGMYDLLGGGFSRYSTDDDWLVPHFEKMLYDNALLARLYLYAYLLTGGENFLEVCRATLDFLEREMRSPEGGFYSSLDADSEGVEGKFYLWSYDEVREVLREAQNEMVREAVPWADVFCAAYEVTPGGNHEGLNVLQRTLTDEELAERFQLGVDQVRSILESARQALWSRHATRTRPATDDKVLVAWNALALTSFAEAARYLKDANYLSIAQSNARFLMENLWVDGALFRSWRLGRANQRAYLEDYAGLALALLELYQTDLDPRWYQAARQLGASIQLEFADPAGGYFDTLPAGDLLFRPKDLQDNAIPCGNSTTCRLLAQLSALSGEAGLYENASAMAAHVQNSAVRYPTAFANWLCAEHFLLGPVKEVALLSASEDIREFEPFTSQLWSRFRPKLVLAASHFPPPPGSPELLRDRSLLNQQTTAFVCENFTCKLPVNTVEDFSEQLEA